MSSALYRLGRAAFARRRAVIGAWVGLLVLIGAAAGLLGGTLDNSVSIPGTESQAALDRLTATFPQAAGTTAQVLVVGEDGAQVDDPAVVTAVEDSVDAFLEVESVTSAVSPFDDTLPGASAVSDDGEAALLTLSLEGEGVAIGDEVKDRLRDVADELDAALPDGYDATIGGQLFSQEFPGLSIAEVLGVVVAFIVLLVTLGGFAAAGMPLLNALLGVGLSTLLVLVAAAFTSVTSTTPLLSLMLGLAVGIDYALFIVSRYRELLATGLPTQEAAARSNATAGSAVIFAGLTVMIALVGLGVAGIPFLTVMGVAGAAAVGIAVLVSITLVPAMLGVAGERLRPRPSRRARKDAAAGTAPAAAPAPAADGDTWDLPEHHNRFFAGWVRLATARPWVTVVVTIGALLALAFPALDLRLALPDAGVAPTDSSQRVTYDRITEHFGPGANGPLVVTGSIVTSDDPLGLMEDVADELRALPGVDSVPLATPNESIDTGIVQVVPTTGPTDPATADLVNAIRDLRPTILEKHGFDLAVTGFTAVGIDVSAKLGAALLPFAVFVVGLSLILLTMVFRSIAVPLKATIGYLLSVAAAFGVVTAVFEHGIAADLLHVSRLGPIISFMPIVLMGVLFGLAMDYEVFLVSRMREDYVHSGKARASIATGFVGSAKVVTAAAVIMVAVFFAFVPEGDINIKPIALGLAVGVAVDAFVVRMTLVPAVMQILGERAWWMPKGLDRVLPSFDVEGEALHREISMQAWPHDPDVVVAARGLRLAALDRTDVVDLAVRRGEVLVAHADEPARPAALLLTVAGRLAPEAGDLKVDGLLLPVRAAAVRRRVGYVDLRTEGVDALDAAVAERPPVLAVDRTDLVTDPHERAHVAAALSRALDAGATLLLGVVGSTPADDLLPAGTPVTTLAPQAGALA
ncbi:MMPL domain protein [Cellulomonas flavigena DSM 20109]|uniref:MMPL domain protein n=1 Tax=Cellulomonas flavigena (strain ATCC 482 / DSM 20109 / BCRC 11376 / JCM 18109 / NBRC 3775 / NCIMB 8073 / NRS 134) TaxID=446466 RepID=D5UL37_CELFN|nr:MMPL family transporter [Cellulomonas flavigena]ADG75919.1 MMPL domain protein [Cellulomonas flavigena DSM 20109]